MPIYEYHCTACDHEEDVMQKFSDAPLTQCPACGAASYRKKVSAAGFQLKGSGWYVTDFRDGGKKSAGSESASAGNDKTSGAGESAGGEKSSAPASSPAGKSGDTNAPDKKSSGDNKAAPAAG